MNSNQSDYKILHLAFYIQKWYKNKIAYLNITMFVFTALFTIHINPLFKPYNITSLVMHPLELLKDITNKININYGLICLQKLAIIHSSLNAL